MADKKISELDSVLQINNDAVFPMSQDNAGEPTTFKTSITQLGSEIAEDMTFSNLQTQSKHIVGAINEAAQASGNSFASLSDTQFTNLQNGQVAKYNSSTQKWENENESAVTSLADLTDTQITSPADNQVPVFNSISNKWENKNAPIVIEKSATGTIATFADGGDNIPVKSYECDINAVESGSGAKSPSNPYTISGWDSVDIRVEDDEHTGNTTTITLPQTVYGGKLIFDNGWKVRVYPHYASYNGETLTGEWLSNMEDYSPNTTPTIGADVTDLSGDTYTDIPISSLDRVKTISGVNNIFANSGDNSLVYFTSNADELASLVKASETQSTGDYHEYSTEEHIVGKWIDGSTLYEQTIDHTFTSSAKQYTVFASGIGAAFCESSMVEYSTDRWLSPNVLSSSNINTTVALAVEKTASGGLSINETGSSARRWIVTFRYTKTSNTRSLSKSLPVEEKTEEVKVDDTTEEVKEAEEK